jgi:hypothetical protein
MSSFARVDSIHALKQFRASLVQFTQAAAVAMEEVDMEIQKTHTWLQQDRYRYWKDKLHNRSEAYTQAKQILNQRQLFERAVQGVPSSCVDERKALQAAEQRLRETEHSFQRVRSWIPQMEREMNDYKGRVKGLASALQMDIPKALARLDRMVDSLEAYVVLAPPETPIPTEQAAKEGVLGPPPVEEEPSQTGEETP